MHGKTYILTAKKNAVSITFKYDFKGRLIFFEVAGDDLTDQQHSWLLGRVPLYETEVVKFKKFNEAFNFDELPVDLSFDRFYDEYGNKKGKKVMAQNAWKKLSKTDKVKALLYIPKLKREKLLDNTAMPYPSTYLNQKYFEN
jgi:predicted HTH transcriptional regulator